MEPTRSFLSATRRRVLGAVVCLTVAMPAAHAADPHGLFERWEGVWKLEYEVAAAAGETPQAGSGYETHRVTPDGRFKTTEFVGELFGAPYSSHGVTSYSAEEGVYHQYYFDASRPTVQPSSGKFDPETGRLVRWSEGLDFDGSPTQWKQVVTFPDEDHYLLEIYSVDRDEHATLRITCRAERFSD